MGATSFAGERIASRTLIEPMKRSGPDGQRWLMRCDCGAVMVATVGAVRYAQPAGCRACRSGSGPAVWRERSRIANIERLIAGVGRRASRNGPADPSAPLPNGIEPLPDPDPVSEVFNADATYWSPPRPDDAVEEAEVFAAVRAALERLAVSMPMEARILRWHYGLDGEDELTLKEIGDKYNLSRERVRQLENYALYRLRVWFAGARVDPYPKWDLEFPRSGRATLPQARYV